MLGKLFRKIKTLLIDKPNESDYRENFETQKTNKSLLSRASTGEYVCKEIEIEWQNFKRHSKIMDESI